MIAEKTLYNKDGNGVTRNVPDVSFFGNSDTFKLICKASSEAEGWMKSTKAMEIKGVGCVVQVTTQQQNKDSSYSLAEAVTFVPGVKIVEVKARSFPGGEVLNRQLVKIKPLVFPYESKDAPKRDARYAPIKYRRWQHEDTGSIVSLKPGKDPGRRWFMIHEKLYQERRTGCVAGPVLTNNFSDESGYNDEFE